MTWTELHDAAEHQDTQGVITRARRNSEEAVFVDDHASTPLHTLCWGNPKVEAVQELIKAFPQAVTDQDILGDTPLHVAASFPETSVEVIKVLLEADSTTASIANLEGLMPLHMACRYAPKNDQVILLLLEEYPYAARHPIKLGEPAPYKKTDHTSRKEGDRAVTDAAGRATMDAVELRFDALREGEKRDGAYPLHMAIASGVSKEVIEALINEAPDIAQMINKFGETPLHVAVATRTKESDLVDMVLTAYYGAACITERRNDNLPLHIAAEHGCSLDVAKRLLDTFPMAGQQRNLNKKLAYNLAVESGSCTEDVLEFLKESHNYEKSKRDLFDN